ncbi:MAG: nicotinate-nicotinamide nucleotide adenylyltransferase [Proteobacteria bacterium]|nr:nicotinate-nicotinamide nucleotide adenylyltransferase [Pseudomonadota bacterium]
MPPYSLLFGLSADPPHKGHEQVIINSIEHLKKNNIPIGEFLLIPVYQPNLIAGKQQPGSSYKHRYQMCKLIADRLSKKLSTPIKVSQIEKGIHQKTDKINYSIDTLKTLDLKNSLLIVSADHFSGRWPKFQKWHQWQQILEISGLLINQRPGYKINLNYINKLKNTNPNIHITKPKISIDISSTKIRNYFKNNSYNNDIYNYLSNNILNFIQKNQLYI